MSLSTAHFSNTATDSSIPTKVMIKMSSSSSTESKVDSTATLSTKRSFLLDMGMEEEDERCRDPTSPRCVKIQKAVDLPTAKSQECREVTFHQVQIRRYPMILGDNPACQIGLPVCLDWEYDELPPLDLDNYESARSKQRRLTELHHMVLSFYQRQRILEKAHSSEELKQAAKQVSKARWQRQQTQLLLPVSKLEEMAQSARRKVKRRLGKRPKFEQTMLAADI